MKSPDCNSDLFGPFHKSHRLAIVRQKTAPAVMPKIFGSRGPSAVRGLVIAVIVCSVQCVLRAWSLAHIRKEIRKVRPAITDLYTTCSVMLERYMFGVFAPLVHALPNEVLRRSMQAVLSDASPERIHRQAPTTLTVTRSQFVTRYFRLIPALAAAFQKLASLKPAQAGNGQASKLFADVRLGYAFDSHVRSPKTYVARACAVFQHFAGSLYFTERNLSMKGVT